MRIERFLEGVSIEWKMNELFFFLYKNLFIHFHLRALMHKILPSHKDVGGRQAMKKLNSTKIILLLLWPRIFWFDFIDLQRRKLGESNVDH